MLGVSQGRRRGEGSWGTTLGDALEMEGGLSEERSDGGDFRFWRMAQLQVLGRKLSERHKVACQRIIIQDKETRQRDSVCPAAVCVCMLLCF